MTRSPQPSGEAVESRSTWPVIVVGAGPAGLTSAITLAGAGIECLVVDRHAGPAPHPRATALSLRTMELLRRWGLESAVTAGGCDVEMQMRVARTLAEVDQGVSVDVGYPTRAQARTISPSVPACVPQDHLEAVLEEHLRTRPTATVRRQVVLTDLQPFNGGYVVELRDLDSGRAWTVHARFVVGADGAHSAVRELLGLSLRATPSVFDGISVVFRAELWSLVGPHRYCLYAVEHPSAAGTLLPAGHDRWVYGFAARHGSAWTLDAYLERITGAAGRRLAGVRVDGVQEVSFIGAIAERFRVGSAFLVGDAAHRVTPRGGTGLNTAVADGFDIGWKLAWVLRGWGAPALLDSYEVERRAVAEHQLARSVQPDGSRCDATRALAVDLGGRIRHAWLADDTGRSTLDLVGDGVTVFHHHRRTSHLASGAAAMPVRHHELDPLTAQALGIMPGGHLAVRPDGVPFPAGSRHCGQLTDTLVRGARHGR